MKPGAFADRVLLRGFEGGAVYTAEHRGKFYVIQDEGTMADLLSDEHLAGSELVKVLEFNTLPDRAAYFRERGWDAKRPNRLPG
jgi:hypothetical protein